MAKTLNISFVKADGTGRKTFKIPEPPVDIDTKTALIEGNMSSYVEGKIPDYTQFDEAKVVETTTNELINLVD
jgi:hypothetical protein